MMHSLRVLVADDDHDTVDSLLLLLQVWGYEGVAAYDAPRAEEMARLHRPDVAFLDISIPHEQDGYTLARKLRPAVPLLVAFTGYGDAEHQHRCLEAGFDLVLSKPVTPKELQVLLGAVEQSGANHPGYVATQALRANANTC